MKTCVVWGDMSADSASDQYPTVTVCDECVVSHSESSEDHDAEIVSIDSSGPMFSGDECYFCGKTEEEEREENGEDSDGDD